MRPKLILAFVLIASIPAWLALAQERVPRTQENESSLKLPQKVDEASVVRISTNLVQVDVTVTDKDGVQIADLKPEEFEIYEDGQLQEITAFTNVGSSSQLRSRVDSSVGGLDPNTAYSRTPPPPIRLRPDQVRRTIAIVVPSLSFASTFAVRETLKDFIRDRLEPNDLVGIFAPRLNLLQQFTSDRNLLALAVRRIVWRPGRDPSIDFFDATRRDFEEKLIRTRDELANPSGGNPSRDPLSPAMIRAGYFGTDEQTSLFASGLGLLIQDMRKLPGRKAIVLFSDGMALNSSLEGKLRLLTDFANRSAVTIHTVHAVGLVNTDYIGADETFTEEQRDQVRNGRARALFSWSGGLNYLAEHTGGTFTRNNNDLGKGLRNALEEQRGYYLLGYRPSDDTFKNGLHSYHKIEVKVKRPDLRVHTRKGFVGVTDEAIFLPPHARTGDSELYAALASPLAATHVHLRLTPLFSYDSKGDPRFRVLVHINASDITFADDANGWKRLTLDVAGVTLGKDGRVANEFTRTHTVRIGPETVEHVRENGLTYSTDVPLKKSGAYQFRIVVRDGVSRKIGTAGQFIEIPDLKQEALAVSSLLLTQADSSGAQEMPAATSIEAAISLVQSPANPAVRRFRAGTVIDYQDLIYNARADKSGQRHLTTQVRLFRDGQEIFTDPEKPLEMTEKLTAERILSRGRLHLPAQAAPGDYWLQIIVTDNAPGEKRRTTSQWIDLEILK